MYSKRSGLILGFHGCDKTVRDRVLTEKGFNLKSSENKYDWLGHGVYFWENNPTRAKQYAIEAMRRTDSSIKTPSVIGAVIDLGHCFDLLDSRNLDHLTLCYDFFHRAQIEKGKEIPKNETYQKGIPMKRNLDCAVIEYVHDFNRKKKFPAFDSVRGVFFEGEELYPDAGFRKKNHIQIAIRNLECIKGFFIPRDEEI